MGIRLKSDDYQGILVMLDNFREGNEFEAVIKDEIDSTRFSRLFQYLLSTRGPFAQHQEVLDVNSQNYRLSIKGLDAISMYCKLNSVSSSHHDNISLIKKQKIVPVHDISDYGVRLRLSSEEEVNGTNAKTMFMTEIKDQPKFYRLKKRFTFDTEDKLFKIDLTVVKESDKAYNRLTYTRIQSIHEKYEVELEYVGKRQKDYKNVVAALFRNLSEILKVLDGVDILVSKSQKTIIITEYASLVRKYMDIRDDWNIDQVIRSNPRRLYLAVKPTTLERRHMLPNESVSLSDDYTCTEKADGERMLVYVAPDNFIYLINNRLDILGTNLKCQTHDYANSLLDAELVSLTKSSKAILLFDAYFIKGQLVASLPLYHAENNNRMDIMNKFASQMFEGNTSYSIRAKKFIVPTKDKSIFDCAKEILSLVSIKQFPYHVDGLIFTPRNLAVGANKPSDNVNFKGTWRNVLKWKPPEENTVDFLVKDRRVEGAGAIDFGSSTQASVLPFTEKTLFLYTGHQSGLTNAYEYFMKKDTQVNKKKREEYVAKLFTPPGSVGLSMATAKIKTDANGQVKCKNGDVIYDGSIVEMSYDTQKETWVPYRVRHDKTEYLKKTKSISNTANDYNIAVSVWRTILFPVTKEHITGEKKLTPEDIPKDDDRYYARNGERTKSATMPMMTFHNYWVKNKHLIGRFKGLATSLMDIACGKAGDLSKWVSNGYTTVLGVDLFEDNITNPNDGAYMRLSQESGITPAHKYAFVKLDASQLFSKENISKEQGFNKHLANVIWGHEKPFKKEDQRIGKLYNMVANKFHVISCQFATHYFFKTDDTLRNFITNIKNHIADNGYFIGTCFDGDAVANLLKSVKKGQQVVGKKNDATIWMIEKKYDEYDPSITGQEIDVYINTINQKLTEYLVGFSRLVQELEKHDIRLLNDQECSLLGLKKSSGLFSDLFEDMITESNHILESSNHHPIKVAAELANFKDEQTLSFINRWFIFKKHPKIQEKKLIIKKPKSPSI